VPRIIPARVASNVSVGEMDGFGEPSAPSTIFANPKSSRLHRARWSDHDVGRLQVAMHDSFLVRRFKSFRDLLGVVEHGLGQQRTLERFALDQFHGHRALFDAVDLRDVGMIQRGQGLGFAIKARQAFRVAGERARKNFDGDVALQLRVVRAIHLTHPTRAERCQDLVLTEFFALTTA